MRRFFMVLLALLLTVCLFGCGKKQDPAATTVPTTVPPAATVPTTTAPAVTEPEVTEPEETQPTLDNTKLYGIDATGMTADEAKTAISNAISNYTLTLTVNGQSMSFSSKTLSMSLSEEGFNTWFQDTIDGKKPTTAGLINYSLDSAVSSVENTFEKEPVNATIVYNKTSKKFVAKVHEDGIDADASAAMSAMRSAVETLSPSISAKVTTKTVPASITDKDSRVSSAIATANGYLGLKISYTYQATGIPTTTESISVDDLASFLTADKDLTVNIYSSGVKDYVSKMSYKNGGTQRRGFVTSYGTTISQTVDYYQAVLDQTGMYNDIVYCLNNKVSGNRNAPFLSSGITNMAYGGSYVEIDLDNQCLWVYLNGEMKIHSPLVSGKVSSGAWTPTGVYSIYGKETCTYLVGPTWRSYVDYWMPFNGGIGLHDASWRSQFGGTIYMYDGSHGCINLPPKNAAVVYRNISVGTKVIVYGGARTVGTLTQELTGITSYSVSTDTTPFPLNIHAKYTGTTITYTSSDTNVVSVDNTGLVTVMGPGTAQITVKSEKLGILSSATLIIDITVIGPEPEPTDPSEPSEPTDPTDPTEPTDPTDPPEPSEPEPTDPPAPTEPEPTDPPAPTDPPEPEPTVPPFPALPEDELE